MDGDLTINARVDIRDGCPMEYSLNADGQVEVSVGGAWQSIELIFDPLALRQFMEVAGSALEQVALAMIRGEGETERTGEEPAP